MDERTLRKIVKEVINEELEPVKSDLAEVKDDVNILKDDVHALKESVLTIEQTVGSYADSYKENQRNIERLDTRLNTTEDELAITVPEDLKVPHFAE